MGRRSEGGKGIIDMPVTTTQAVIVRFKREELFPSSNEFSVQLLRLMAATNDVRHLQKLVLTLFDKEEPTTQSETIIREGELGYFLRLFCAHLSEVGNALRCLDSICKRQVDFYHCERSRRTGFN